MIHFIRIYKPFQAENQKLLGLKWLSVFNGVSFSCLKTSLKKSQITNKQISREKKMLLFDFYCEKCGIFELILDSQNTNESVLCPTCQLPAQRLFSTPAFYRTFSGNRHHLMRKAEKGREPFVVKKGTGDPLEARLPSSHPRHEHKGCASSDSGYPPWMLKH